MKFLGLTWVLFLLGCPSSTVVDMEPDGGPEGAPPVQDVAKACASTSTEVRDTMGNRFGYDCDRKFLRPCVLRTLPDSPSTLSTCGGKPLGSQEKRDFMSVAGLGRLALICEGTNRDGSFSPTSLCRPMACSCKDDCPAPLACQKGLCQLPGAAIAKVDLVALCLADRPWESSCEEFGETVRALNSVTKDALRACSDETHCPAVPDACRQP